MKKSPSLTNVKASASIPRNISLERLDELGLDEQVQEGGESQVPSANDVRSTHLNHFAITLANRHRILPTKGKTVLIQRLNDNVKVLRQAYDSVQDAITQGRRITSAEEWLVDNFWLITEQIHMAKKHLPPGYSKEMPKLANTELSGLPRIYGLVLELISLVNAQITQENIFQFVKSYQSVAPLNIGEVWGIPIMLRLGLLENIRRVCDDIITMRKDRNNADQWADKLLEASDSKTVIQVLFTMSQSGVKISNAFVLQILQRLQGSDPLLGVITTWLEQNLSTQGLDVDDINRAERHSNHVNLVRLRNSIISLRFVNVHSWKEYAEEQSYMESILRKDPSGIYAKQDFETRDACRHAVEGISAHNKIDEQQVASAALEMATQAKEKLAEVEKSGTEYEKTIQRRKAFIGYYLLTPEGNFLLRTTRGYKVSIVEKIQKSLGIEVPVTAFLTSISLITLIFSAFVLGFFYRHVGSTLDYSSSWVLASVSALVVATAFVGSQLGVSLTNQLVIHFVRPSLLPRMDFMETGIPDEHRTMVVVPTMLTSLNGVKELLDDLRARFLVNRDKNLYYALITDFGDSKTQTTPNDDILLSEAVKGIEELNALYPNTKGATQTTFYLFHRPRIYNPTEGVFMGYERKRGKLTAYTNLLRGGPTDPFQKIVGDLSILKTIQYVITLDTDTLLPSDAARKMVGNASHILNKPLINPKADRVVGGYGLLQPRVSVGLNGAFKSYYALINSLDSGLDPYTKYVSDVYQDAFGEGSFIGKGLYHVDAFHQVFSDRFPENRILSHDLLEGCYVRSALVSDVELIEEYPSSYLTEASRRHRWVRGDWQIASWILPIVPSPKGYSRNPLTTLSKWKIFDNLRRSLVPLAMVTLLSFGWLSKSFSSGLPLLSSLSVFAVFLIPMTIDSIEELIFVPEDTSFRLHINNWGYSMTRRTIDLAINFVFLPFEAYNNVDAIIRCMTRLIITRTLLLQWVTSTSAASAFAGNQLFKMLRVLWVEPIWAIGVSVFLVLHGLRYGVSIDNTRLFLYNSLHVWGLLLTWISSPIIGWYLSKPLETMREIKESAEDLTDHQKSFLRVLARKTWRFFEVFVRQEDNYLPLDNFQEFPKPMYARRTSPTNIAMGLLTNISAWDFGYITAANSIDRVEKALSTLMKMERFRGHFYNWYDTADLRPLLPKYVSAVDSGNLVGYLIILRTSLLEFVDSAVLPKRIFAQGIHDNILVMREIVQKKDEEDEDSNSKLDVNAVLQQLKEINQSLEAPSVVQVPQWINDNSKRVKALISTITNAVESRKRAEREEAEVVPEDVPVERIESKEQQLLYYANALEKQLNDINSELNSILPWIHSLPVPSSVEKIQDAVVRELVKTITALNLQVTLRQAAQLKAKLSTQISQAKSVLSGSDLEWLNRLDEQLTVGAKNASARIDEVTRLADITDKMADQDFSFLYNPTRNLISIGFNVDHNRLDNAYYDTFCSEARLCSFAGIARGQFPVKHWFSMSRLLTTQGRKPTLLSWSGSMFEYLMPLLVMKTYPGTLLDQTYYAVVMRQIEYGQQKRVPWGISESAYNMMDAGLVYQYGPFGVPGLGLKRGLSNDLVIAPYASAMALMVLPVQACKNLQTLTQHGLQGSYGMYEAVDYTPHRLRGHMTAQPIQAYFSHHSGMSFLSLAYTLLDQPMQKRFDATPEYHANELLLQEKIPRMPYISNPNEQETSRWMSPNLNAPSSNRRFHGSQTTAPEVHLLSNGNLHVMATTHGGGYVNYEVKSGRASEVISVTRWKEDVTVDGFAVAAYVRDMSNHKYWTTTSNPIKATEQSNYSVMFSQGKAEYRRTENQITSHTTVTVSPYDDVEVRRITVKNDSATAKNIEVTSYSEIVLGGSRLDAVHRAFATLFVKTEVLTDQKAILAFRKPRGGKEKTYYAFHIMLLHDTKAAASTASFETDRNKFVGRGHGLQDPAVMSPSCTALSNSAGYPLDPIFGIRQELSVAPSQSINIDFITGAAATREEALKIIQKYQKKKFTNYVIDYSWISSQKLDFRLGITAVEAQLFGKLAGCLLYANSKYRASPRLIAKNRLNQSGLWRLGISGDNSVILVRIGDVQNIELIAQVLQAHTYFRANGLVCDLIIWNDETSSYRDDLQSTLLSLIASSSETSQRLEKPGGIYPIRGERLTEQEGVLLYSVARVVLSDTGGRLVDQINRHLTKEADIPKMITHPETYEPKGVEVYPVLNLEQRNLILTNQFGGFDKKLREYVIQLQKEKPTTPAPWVNILANEHFGTVISEKGSSYTWYANAHEYRLTPWNNDPVLDESGEAYYIRDENTGKFWSPLPQPVPGKSVYMCRHGMGYSTFEHLEDGIRTDTTVFVPQNEPVKVVLISLRNNSGKTRKLSVTGFVEWTLGELRDRSYPNIVTDIEAGGDSTAIVARNPYHLDFFNYVSFFMVVGHKCTFTANRSEFIGFNRTLAHPAAMDRTHLSGTLGAALDPCAALNVPIVLEDGKNVEVAFVLGASHNHTSAKDLIERIRSNLIIRQLLKNIKAFWNHTLNTIQVETPDPELDVLANGWLLYQVLSARIWGRTGFYQSSGAFGFRDQLQDAMALNNMMPNILKQQIVTCCEHQFEKGDVLHWWHPQSNRGVRTTFSDDYLWLPMAVTLFVESTGDKSFLDFGIRFVTGIAELGEGEESRFDQVRPGDIYGSVYEHCKRAIKYGMKYGVHGIPLMGCGDWNDGMNLVGIHGKGESVWLAFFLIYIMDGFVKMSEIVGDTEFIQVMKKHKEFIMTNIEKNCWDGEWYVRAFFDNGTPLGSKNCDECQIDSLPQSWGLLSKAANPQRARIGMESAYKRLVRHDLGLVQLFSPCFDKSELDPGYIKGYAPGVRENGGQYTHAAIWLTWAFTILRDHKHAWELFDMLNPINHTKTPQDLLRYRVEPYVIAADVYTLEGHEGQGGWTWYTGSAGWMYRLIMNQILGIQRLGDTLAFNPLPRKEWKEYKIHFRQGKATYHITFKKLENLKPEVESATSCVKAITVDGELTKETILHVEDDQKEHDVLVELFDV